MEAETHEGKEKTDQILTRLPRPCRRAALVWVVLAQFGFPVN
jgi:hypothetical protein